MFRTSSGIHRQTGPPHGLGCSGFATTQTDRILHAARNKGRVTLDGQIVSFYMDFYAEVVRRRQESADAHSGLPGSGDQISFVYPAVRFSLQMESPSPFPQWRKSPTTVCEDTPNYTVTGSIHLYSGKW